MRHLLIPLALIASPATAQTYGPPVPKPFVMPDRFVVQPNETIEDAQAKVTKQRRCARTWALIGAVGGTALDVATTQINQRDGYSETNPIYGKHASVGEMLLFRGVTGAFSFWRITKSAKRNPAKACSAAKVFAGVSFIPGVVNAAVRVRF